MQFTVIFFQVNGLLVKSSGSQPQLLPVGATKQPMSVDQWVQLVNAKDNDPTLTPQTAPARNPPQWERFTTIQYGVIGAFKSPQARATMRFLGPVEGGGEGHADHRARQKVDAHDADAETVTRLFVL